MKDASRELVLSIRDKSGDRYTRPARRRGAFIAAADISTLSSDAIAWFAWRFDLVMSRNENGVTFRPASRR